MTVDKSHTEIVKNIDKAHRHQPRNQRNGNHKKHKSIRKLVEKRDGKKCFICWSKTSRLILHHSFELSNGKSPYEDPYNEDYQILLCDSCHRKVHDLYDRDSPLMRGYKDSWNLISEKPSDYTVSYGYYIEEGTKTKEELEALNTSWKTK